MDKPTSFTLSAAVIALLALCGPAGAAEAGAADAAKPVPEHAVRKKAATQPVAPHPAAAEDAYRCHPNEDIACTVVRETAAGTMIVTYRPAARSATTPAWMIVSGPPPSAGPQPGGTIYVVPTSTREPAPLPQQAALMYVNGAPILD
jgi:hypothetical protein